MPPTALHPAFLSCLTCRSAWGRTDGDAGEQRQQQQQGSQLGQTAAGKDARESASTHVGNSTGEQTPPACWHMRGRLTNAATGQTIALVEGVELSRNLAFETAQSEREKRRKQKKKTELGTRGAKADKGEGVLEEAGEELEVDKALRPGKWTAFGSLASKKFFMYQVRRAGVRLLLKCEHLVLYAKIVFVGGVR